MKYVKRDMDKMVSINKKYKSSVKTDIDELKCLGNKASKVFKK